jgi:uncharacterized membrane protein
MTPRRNAVTRLEGFSDAVFGFALTLLVVALETPKDDAGLRDLVRGLVPFAATFAMVCWIWYQHNLFFRRYGVEDAWTVFLNCVLLFVVLFYVYPLKYLTNRLMGELTGDQMHGFRGVDGQFVMVLYSSGVVAIFVTFVLLHWHVRRRRHALGLDERALTELHYATRAHVISASLGVTSLAFALAFGRLAGLAGLLYGLMGPLHAWNGYRAGQALARIDAAGAPARPAGAGPEDAGGHA